MNEDRLIKHKIMIHSKIYTVISICFPCSEGIIYFQKSLVRETTNLCIISLKKIMFHLSSVLYHVSHVMKFFVHFCVFLVFFYNVCCLRQNSKLKLHYHCNMS